jgi:hypothetical protein
MQPGAQLGRRERMTCGMSTGVAGRWAETCERVRVGLPALPA